MEHAFQDIQAFKGYLQAVIPPGEDSGARETTISKYCYAIKHLAAFGIWTTVDAQCQGWTLGNNERAALNHLALFNRMTEGPAVDELASFFVREVSSDELNELVDRVMVSIRSGWPTPMKDDTARKYRREVYKILSRFLAGRPSEEGGEPPTSRVGLRGDVLSCLRKINDLTYISSPDQPAATAAPPHRSASNPAAASATAPRTPEARPSLARALLPEVSTPTGKRPRETRGGRRGVSASSGMDAMLSEMRRVGLDEPRHPHLDPPLLRAGLLHHHHHHQQQALSHLYDGKAPSPLYLPQSVLQLPGSSSSSNLNRRLNRPTAAAATSARQPSAPSTPFPPGAFGARTPSWSRPPGHSYDKGELQQPLGQYYQHHHHAHHQQQQQSGVAAYPAAAATGPASLPVYAGHLATSQQPQQQYHRQLAFNNHHQHQQRLLLHGDRYHQHHRQLGGLFPAAHPADMALPPSMDRVRGLSHFQGQQQQQQQQQQQPMQTQAQQPPERPGQRASLERRAPSAAQGSKQPADATKRDSLSKLARQLRKEVEDEGYTDMGPVLRRQDGHPSLPSMVVVTQGGNSKRKGVETGGLLAVQVHLLQRGGGEVVTPPCVDSEMRQAVRVAVTAARLIEMALRVAGTHFNKTLLTLTQKIQVSFPNSVHESGNSAGLCILLNLLQELTGCQFGNVAVSGAVSLRGLVLWIEGVVCKVQGGLRWHECTRLLFPTQNADEATRACKAMRGARLLEVHTVSSLGEALPLALQAGVAGPLRQLPPISTNPCVASVSLPPLREGPNKPWHTITVEAAITPGHGKGRLLLTGVPEEERHGGMVLKAIDDALTAVRTPALHNRLLEKLQELPGFVRRLDLLGLKVTHHHPFSELFESCSGGFFFFDVHIHIHSESSAAAWNQSFYGCLLLVALLSLATGLPINPRVAVLGELWSNGGIGLPFFGRELELDGAVLKQAKSRGLRLLLISKDYFDKLELEHVQGIEVRSFTSVLDVIEDLFKQLDDEEEGEEEGNNDNSSDEEENEGDSEGRRDGSEDGGVEEEDVETEDEAGAEEKKEGDERGQGGRDINDLTSDTEEVEVVAVVPERGAGLRWELRRRRGGARG